MRLSGAGLLVVVATLSACTSGSDLVAVRGSSVSSDGGRYLHGPVSSICVPGTYVGCIENDADAAQVFHWASIAFALVQADTTAEVANLSKNAEVDGKTDTGALFKAKLGSDGGCQAGKIVVEMTDGHYILSASDIPFTGHITGSYDPGHDDPHDQTGGRFIGTWDAQATGLPLRFNGSWSADWVSSAQDGGELGVDSGLNSRAGCPSLH
jgi:hypothetical protein